MFYQSAVRVCVVPVFWLCLGQFSSNIPAVASRARVQTRLSCYVAAVKGGAHAYHMSALEPHDKEQYDSLQRKQMKVIHITVKDGGVCSVTSTCVYLCFTSIFMDIPDDGLTPALFCLK